MFIGLFEISSLGIEFGITANHRPLVLIHTIANTLAKSKIAFLRNSVSTVACSRLPPSRDYHPETPTFWDRKVGASGIDKVQTKYLVYCLLHIPT